MMRKGIGRLWIFLLGETKEELAEKEIFRKYFLEIAK